MEKRNFEKQADHRLRVFSIFLVIFVMASVIHGSQWDRHFFSIFPLKIAEITGVASEAQLRALAEICLERKKPACQIRAYHKLLEINIRDYDTLLKMGEVQYLSGRYQDATKSLEQYFSDQNNSSRRGAYVLAKAHEKLRNYDMAIEAYKKALSERDDLLQVSVSEDYVKLLVNRGQYDEARKFIRSLWSRGAPKYFLESEFSEIQKVLSKRS